MNKLLSVIILLMVAGGSVKAQQKAPPIRNFVRINE